MLTDDRARLVHILGPLELFDGAGYRWIGAPKRRALLAALAIHRGRVLSIDRICVELWGDTPPRGAPNLVHGYVMRLRRVLGDHGRLLVTRSPGYQLTVPPDRIDAGRFDQLVTEGLAALDMGRHREASDGLAAALTLWRGPALADVPVTPLVQAEVTRLDELRLTAVEARVDADLALGRAATLTAELRALVRAHPLRERLWAQLMLALHRTGRGADALVAYRQLCRVLREELGVSPNPTLRQLHEHIRAAGAPCRVPDCRCGCHRH